MGGVERKPTEREVEQRVGWNPASNSEGEEGFAVREVQGRRAPLNCSEHFRGFFGAHSNANRSIDYRIRAELETGFRSPRNELADSAGSRQIRPASPPTMGPATSSLSAPPTGREIIPPPPRIPARYRQQLHQLVRVQLVQQLSLSSNSPRKPATTRPIWMPPMTKMVRDGLVLEGIGEGARCVGRCPLPSGMMTFNWLHSLNVTLAIRRYG